MRIARGEKGKGKKKKKKKRNSLRDGFKLFPSCSNSLTSLVATEGKKKERRGRGGGRIIRRSLIDPDATSSSHIPLPNVRDDREQKKGGKKKKKEGKDGHDGQCRILGQFLCRFSI